MIVVCGEALIDMIHNPDGTQRAAPGGGPFNTARALARLGVPTAFLGHLSNDKFGRELADLLVTDGASLELATIGPEPTTIALADVGDEGFAEYQFLVQGTSAPGLTMEMLPDRLPDSVNALHIGTLGLVLEPMASTIVELVRREGEGRLIMLDPNVRVGLGNDSDYRERLMTLIAQSTIVKASDTDLAWLYPECDYQGAVDEMVGSGVRLAVVTLGGDGAFGGHGELRVSVPAPPVDVVDTIGAGDSFGAALLAWLYEHRDVRSDLSLNEDELRAALAYACHAAALTVARAGADPPTKEEMRGVSA